jgi:transposase InsO family protein
MVVMDQFTRRIIGFAVQPGAVDGPALCRMFNEVITGRALTAIRIVGTVASAAGSGNVCSLDHRRRPACPPARLIRSDIRVNLFDQEEQA